jgi:hypothetical protein
MLETSTRPPLNGHQDACAERPARWTPAQARGRVRPLRLPRSILLTALGLLASCSSRTDTGPVRTDPPVVSERTSLLDDAAASPVRVSGPASGDTEIIPLNTGTKLRFKGLAIDPRNDRAYLGSWDEKQIVVVDLRSKTHRNILTRYSGKLNGMGVHLRGDKLYAVMNEVNDEPGARALSVLVVIDVVSLEVLNSYELRGSNGRHHFNHVVVDARGVAYVSDTLKASIYTVDTEDPHDSLRLLVEHEDLSWVHGIDLSPDGSKLFCTSYAGGIRILDLKTLELAPFKDLSTAGDDGLAYHEGNLYGVGQNAIKRYVLNPAEDAVIGVEVLLRDHEYFNDPRCLHIENGWIYTLANIELEPVTFRSGKASRDQPLTDSYLVKYRL